LQKNKPGRRKLKIVRFTKARGRKEEILKTSISKQKPLEGLSPQFLLHQRFALTSHGS
jgi:hypothetical protein